MAHIDFCIHNSLPSNTLSFDLAICPMDDTDIERAKEKNFKVNNMNE